MADAAHESRALSELVKKHVGKDRRLTVREFRERAVDPETGYRPSTGLVGNIITDIDFKITPKLISALAAGLGIGREAVSMAAHAQFIGFDVDDPTEGEHDPGATVRIAHDPGLGSADMSKAKQWLAEQEQDGT